MYDFLGQLTDAEQAYRRALAAVNESPQASALDRAMVLANLSTLYTETGSTRPGGEVARRGTGDSRRGNRARRSPTSHRPEQPRGASHCHGKVTKRLSDC